MKNKKTAIFVIALVAFFCVMIPQVITNVYAAAADGYFESRIAYPDDADTEEKQRTFLHSATNTTASQQVSSGTPMITFITHGLGGNASYWSNTLNADGTGRVFAYKEDSLIEELRKKAGGADVYWARFDGLTDFDLFICPQYATSKTVYEISSLSEVSVIPSISNHIIVVFETDRSGYSNAIEYDQFHLMADKIIYDVKALNNNILPKVNLIGHSRGGLINLMYALDHPMLVDSMFSLGTPYISSNSAEIVTDPGTGGGQSDIITPEIYSELYWRWQKGYSAKYSNIKVYALGGYSTVDYLAYAVLTYTGTESLLGNEETIRKARTILNTVNILLKVTPLEAAKLLTPTQIESIASQFGQSVSGQAVHDFLNDIGYENFWDFIFRRHVIFNDVFVDLDSQLGRGQVLNIDDDGNLTDTFIDVEYTGFIREQKRFSIFNSNISNVSRHDIAIVHNLEAQDKQLIQYIIANIPIGTASDYYDVSVTENGLYKLHLGIQHDNDTILDLTDTPLDKDIEIIAENTFVNNFLGQNYTSVKIPSTVKRIEDGAFENCTSLTSVIFEENSQLEYIGARAFAGCTALTSIVLPNSLQWIGTEAFAGTALTTVTLYANVNFIGDAAFGNIESLTSINVVNNPLFCSIEGNLYGKSGSKVNCMYQYTIGNTATTFNVPADVVTIMPYAFSGANNLQSVNLQNVTQIKKGAFAGCVNLNTVSGMKVNIVEDDIFLNTPYYDNSSLDFLKLGKALLKYNGFQTVINKSDLEGINTIATGAFVNNTALSKVFIPSSVQDIYTNAFYGCPNLTEIVVYDSPMLQEDAVFGASESFKFTVPYSSYNTILSQDNWKQYEIQTKTVNITFDSQGGTDCFGITLYFGQQITALPVPVKANAEFSGWFLSTDSDAIQYRTNDLWNIYEDTVLYAQYGNFYYNITYVLFGGENNPDNPARFTSSDETFKLLNPEKPNHAFKGWYTEEAMENHVTEIVKGTEHDVVLFAKWVELCTVTYEVLHKGEVVKSWTSEAVEPGSIITLPQSNCVLGMTIRYWSNTSLTPGTKYVVRSSQTLTGILRPLTLSETGNYIYIWEQLNEFRNSVNNGNNFSGKTVTLGANITLPSTSWTPIANFKGVFDGNNKTISGLTISIPANDNAPTAIGLFGTNNGTIKNLRLINVNIYGAPYHNNIWINVGGLCGLNNGTVSNSTAQGEIQVHRTFSRCGGITGYNKGIVEGCTFGILTEERSILRGNGDMAGIAGNNNGTIRNCNIVNVIFRVYTVYTNRSIGGFVGYNNGGTVIYSTIANTQFEIYGYDTVTMQPAMGFAVGNLCDYSTMYGITLSSTPTYTYGNLSDFDKRYYFAALNGLCGKVGANVTLAAPSGAQSEEGSINSVVVSID